MSGPDALVMQGASTSVAMIMNKRYSPINMHTIGLSTHPGTDVDGASGREESSQISF